MKPVSEVRIRSECPELHCEGARKPMGAQGHKPFHIVLLLTVALVSITYESAISAARKFVGSSQTEQGPGPIPPDGPLARPKPLQQIGVPLEATRAAAPADNPETPEKIALGEKLFFEGRLSVDGTVACSTCHDPTRAFTDGRPVSIGVNGRAGQRNAPTILNALYNVAQFWDGRAKTLEEQAALPIINPSEMGQPSLDAAVVRIAPVAEYEQAFRRVFGRAPNGPILCAPSRPTSAHNSHSIPHSTVSSGATKTQSASPLNGAGTCSNQSSV